MASDACWLARATWALFRSHRRKLHEYFGQAMSCQVLDQWAGLGIGAAIMPKSKLSARAQNAMLIVDKAGHEATLSFGAAWARPAGNAAPLQAFAKHLRDGQAPQVRGH